LAGEATRSRATGERLRSRRRFALRLIPLAVLLLALGALFTGKEGLASYFGLVALGQGIGLAVALLWLGLGYNPMDRK
jgi:hypothetical protein